MRTIVPLESTLREAPFKLNSIHSVCVAKVQRGTLKFRDGRGEVEQLLQVVVLSQEDKLDL